MRPITTHSLTTLASIALVVGASGCGPDSTVAAGTDSTGDSTLGADTDDNNDGTGLASTAGSDTATAADGSQSDTGSDDAIGTTSSDTDPDDDGQPQAPRCGDGIVDPDEECDDGNGNDRDGCTFDCIPSEAVLWSSTVSPGTGNACARAVAIAPDGTVAVGGWTQAGQDKVNAWLGLLDGQDGAEQWSEDWDGGAQERDEIAALAFDDAGDLYVAVTESNNTSNAWLDKRTADGDPLWKVRLETTGGGAENAADLLVDADGTASLLATFYPARGPNGARLQRYSPAGEPLWPELLAIPLAPQTPPSLSRTDSGLRVTGERSNLERSFAQGFVDDYDTQGNLQWSSLSNPPLADVERVPIVTRADGSSTLVLVDAFAPDTIVLRSWDDQGLSLDTAVPALSLELRLADAALDSDGNLLVAGSDLNHAWTIKLDPDGAVIWARRFSGPGTNPDAHAVVVADNDDVIVAGCTRDAQGDNAIWVRRYAP